MTKYANNIGVRVPELLLPNKDVDATSSPLSRITGTRPRR